MVHYQPATVELYNYDSPLRTLAMQLLSWCELDPMSAETSACAMALMQSVSSAGRMTTQEAAFAAISLSKYFAYNRGEGESDLLLTSEDADIQATVAGDDNYSLRNDLLRSLSALNRGSARGYVFWTVDGVPLTAPEPENSGLAAEVTYFDRLGFKVESGTTVERGQKITGAIRITPLSGSAKNLVVVIPFAAGFEVENPKLTGATTSDPSGTYGASRSELRDDRLLLFIDHIDRPLEWRFEMRAVTSGNFTLPPIAAEGMYPPGAYSIGATGSISVR